MQTNEYRYQTKELINITLFFNIYALGDVDNSKFLTGMKNRICNYNKSRCREKLRFTEH